MIYQNCQKTNTLMIIAINFFLIKKIKNKNKNNNSNNFYSTKTLKKINNYLIKKNIQNSQNPLKRKVIIKIKTMNRFLIK